MWTRISKINCTAYHMLRTYGSIELCISRAFAISHTIGEAQYANKPQVRSDTVSTLLEIYLDVMRVQHWSLLSPLANLHRPRLRVLGNIGVMYIPATFFLKIKIKSEPFTPFAAPRAHLGPHLSLETIYQCILKMGLCLHLLLVVH